MADKVLVNRRSGDRLTVLVGTGESGGTRFRFEYVARAPAPAPPNHAHADQEEFLAVVSGTVSCRIGDHLHHVGPGETLVIPRGVPHAVWSADPAGSRSIGEFRPAGDTQARFESSFAAD